MLTPTCHTHMLTPTCHIHMSDPHVTLPISPDASADHVSFWTNQAPALEGDKEQLELRLERAELALAEASESREKLKTQLGEEKETRRTQLVELQTARAEIDALREAQGPARDTELAHAKASLSAAQSEVDELRSREGLLNQKLGA